MGHPRPWLILLGGLAVAGCPRAGGSPADPPAVDPPKAGPDAGRAPALPPPTVPPAPTVAPEPRSGVEVRILAKPGAFQVRAGGDAVDLSRDVLVEREADGGGHPVAVVQLLESCGLPGADAGACVSLPAGATLTPVPWTGFTCDAQCPRGCRANAWEGPGTFRFVVRSCDGTRRWRSAPFALPARP